MTLFSLFLIFLVIINPLGNIQGFITATERLADRRQKIVILREMALAFGIMLAATFAGPALLDILDVSDMAAFCGSGIILFLAAYRTLFPKQNHHELKRELKEPFLLPLAIPMIASPALLATIMLYTSYAFSPSQVLGPLCAATLVSTLLLLFSRALRKILGLSGLAAAEKLMGLVLILLAVQRILQGIILFHANTIGATQP
jgi:multiple antibiotic resistance protein